MKYKEYVIMGVMFVTLSFYFFTQNTLSFLCFFTSLAAMMLHQVMEYKRVDEKTKILSDVRKITDKLEDEMKQIQAKLDSLTFRGIK